MSKLNLNKLLNYRSFLKKSVKTNKLNLENKLILVCFLNSLTNKALLLSKLFFLEKKNNSWFNLQINSNIKFINNKFCLFFFNSLIELSYFIFLSKSLTLTPYIFFPVKILSGNSRLELPLNILNVILVTVLKTSFNIFFFWKNLLVGLFFFFFNLLSKNKCLH